MPSNHAMTPNGVIHNNYYVILITNQRLSPLPNGKPSIPSSPPNLKSRRQHSYQSKCILIMIIIIILTRTNTSSDQVTKVLEIFHFVSSFLVCFSCFYILLVFSLYLRFSCFNFLLQCGTAHLLPQKNRIIKILFRVWELLLQLQIHVHRKTDKWTD